MQVCMYVCTYIYIYISTHVYTNSDTNNDNDEYTITHRNITCLIGPADCYTIL